MSLADKVQFLITKYWSLLILIVIILDVRYPEFRWATLQEKFQGAHGAGVLILAGIALYDLIVRRPLDDPPEAAGE